MLITFIGNPADPRDTCGKVRIGGVDFPLNIAVEVDETPQFTKLRCNGHFAVCDAAAVVEPPKEESPQPLATDRAFLIEEAERRGIEIDKRWSTGRIQQHLEGAE